MGIFSGKSRTEGAQERQERQARRGADEAEGGRNKTVLSARAEIKDATLVVPEEDVEVNGRWTGKSARIVCNTLYVNQGAVVEGTVVAKRMRVAGQVRGDVSAGMLLLSETADVDGVVKCRQMSAQPKARIKGTMSCDMSESIGELPATNEAMDSVMADIRPARLAAG